MSISSHPGPLRLPFAALGVVLALIAAELFALSLLYQHNFDFTCRAAAPVWFCAAVSQAVPRSLGVLAALALFALARREALAALLATSGPLRAGLLANGLGLALALSPWVFLNDASPAPLVTAGALAWVLGALLIVGGLALILAPLPTWVQFLRAHGAVLVALSAAGLLLPELADLLLPLWRIEAVTEVTFAAVLTVLNVLGYAVQSLPADKIIGTDAFAVAVGPQCSGVEGFLLITVFPDPVYRPVPARAALSTGADPLPRRAGGQRAVQHLAHLGAADHRAGRPAGSGHRGVPQPCGLAVLHRAGDPVDLGLAQRALVPAGRAYLCPQSPAALFARPGGGADPALYRVHGLGAVGLDP